MTLRRDQLLFVHGSPNSQHEYLPPDMVPLQRLSGSRQPARRLCSAAIPTSPMSGN